MATHIEDIEDPTKGSVVVEIDKDDISFNDKKDTIALEAQIAADEEHQKMSLLAAIKKYPASCFWSTLFSTALIMEGFDHAFITGFFAFPEFQERFGKLTTDGDYQIPASLQAAVSNGVNAGEIIGLLLNGYAADRFGYRWVMIVSLILMIAFVFLQFFTKSIYMYLGAEILLGIPWGVFQTLTTTYAAEVCPTMLRPYLTMLVSLCWSIGYLIGSSTLRGFLKMDGEWAYRIPFALQWVWPVPLMIGIYFAPESPWWLIRKGRVDKARDVVKKLLVTKDATEDEIEQQVSMMIYTDRIETEMRESSTFLDCFKGIDLRRTEIAVIAYCIQNMCTPLLGNSVYFLEQAGLSTDYSYDFACIQYALAIVGVFTAWYLVAHIGRRLLFVSGIAANVFCLFLIAFLGIPSTEKNPNLAYGIGSILLVEYFLFFITVGPITYTIVTEIPSNKLRSKTVVLGRAAYNVISIVCTQLVTRQIQNTSWGWGAKAGFFWGAILAMLLVWSFFRVPETKDRTFTEIDILFKNRVKTRDFTKTEVDIASEETYMK